MCYCPFDKFVFLTRFEMAAVMMFGVWLLFNQHCCAAGDVDGKVRNPLVDRRSALEKNFMRFGRSWGSADDRHGVDSPLVQLTHADDNDVETMAPTILRLKSSSNDETRDNYEKGITSTGKFYRALNNFIRFEKTIPSSELKRLYQIQDEFERGARGTDNFMRFGRGGDNFMRFGREKDNNFMRFGRSNDPEFRYTRSINFERDTRDKDLVRFGRQRQADKGDGFIRFGRQFDPSLRLVKRSLKDSDNSDDESSDNSRSSRYCVQPPLLTDANVLVAPELLLLPEIFHKPPLNRNFMRLG